MIKIIWLQSELSQLKQALEKQHILHQVKANDQDHVTIEIDDQDEVVLKKVFRLIEYEKMQMFFPTKDGFVQIHLNDIYYLEAFGDDIDCHMGAEIEHIKKPLYQLEEMLRNYQFVRISKSYIVNLRKIQYVKVGYNAKLKLELVNGEKLDVTRSYVKAFKESLKV